MATTREVPAEFYVAINGTAYMLDPKRFRRQTLDVIRQQADPASERYAASLNPQDLWRAFQDDWVLGAGQRFVDLRGSKPSRFFSSRGADVWTRGKIKALPDTAEVGSLSGTVGKMVSTGPRLYVIRGNYLDYWDGATWTSTSTTHDGGGSTTTIVDLATDGYNVFFTDGAWLYFVSGATDTPQRITNLSVDSVAFVKGRLMCSAGADLYNITDITPADPAANTPDPLGALVNTDWTWEAWGGGPAYIYVGGSSGDKSAIWRIGVREDATGLSAAAEATPMPDGEKVVSIVGYLGLLILGTSKGVRLAIPQGQSLVMGDLIETGAPVYGLEPQGRFCWFTWTDHEGSGNGGLGRVDLSRFADDLVPAHASDLMVATSATIRSVVTYDGKRTFVVEDDGVYEETTSDVPTWYVTAGLVTHQLADDKVFHQLSARHSQIRVGESLRARVWVDHDSDTLVPDGSDLPVLDEVVNVLDAKRSAWLTDKDVGDAKGEVALVRFDAIGPVELLRWMLRSQPVVSRTTAILLPIDLVRSATSPRSSRPTSWTPRDEYESLKVLEAAGTFVDVQLLGEQFTAIVENVAQGDGLRIDDRHEWFEGPCDVTLKVFS